MGDTWTYEVEMALLSIQVIYDPEMIVQKYTFIMVCFLWSIKEQHAILAPCPVWWQ
jgi:hypothetical protein